MEEDIVLVTIQYRLNIFGYMSTEDATTPGNYGSLDQVEALKWIQENIAAYGGDPDKVPLTTGIHRTFPVLRNVLGKVPLFLESSVFP